jgi:hypothetical protein
MLSLSIALVLAMAITAGLKVSIGRGFGGKAETTDSGRVLRLRCPALPSPKATSLMRSAAVMDCDNSWLTQRRRKVRLMWEVLLIHPH